MPHDLEVENQSTYTMYVAVGYYAEKGEYDTRTYGGIVVNSPENEWVAEGLYKIGPRESLRVYSGRQSFVFLHVHYFNQQRETPYSFVVDDDKKNTMYAMVKEDKDLGFKGSWWMHREHLGYRLCYNTKTKRYGLRYGEKYAYSAGGPVSFDQRYPNVLDGPNLEDVKCGWNDGFYKLRFKEDTRRYKLHFGQADNGGINYWIRPQE